MKKSSYTKFIGTVFLVLSLAVGLFLVQKAVQYFTGASNLPANLIVDLSTNYGEQSDAWRNLAQGGEERGRSLLPIISQVKGLRPQYIRIDHVFDYYDQGTLDAVISDITATGAKPFIALSYMPPSMSSTGSVTDIPRSWADWEAKVQGTIEHISGRSGLGISNVYYEVWNEPDLFGNFKIGGSKSYLDLYLHSAIGASHARGTLPYKFGGPATTGYYQNWMTSLLDFTSKNNLRLDFLSWHRYSKNLSDFETDKANARTLLSDYGRPNLEMLVTEIGPNGANDKAYDTVFGAIHALATAVVLQGEVTRTFTFEIKDGPGPSQFWDRWGLYTHEKFGAPLAKPRASAITFLNNMIGGDKFQVYGQGTWVRSMAKKINDKVTRILVVNYDPNGSHNEIVPIKLTNLSFPNFTFKRTDFLGGVSSQEVATTSANWSTTAYFKPNSAAIFEITAP